MEVELHRHYMDSLLRSTANMSVSEMFHALRHIAPEVPDDIIWRIAVYVVTTRCISETRQTAYYPFANLAVAVLAVLGTVTAGVCNAEDHRYHRRALASGGQNTVYTDEERTGVQKVFLKRHEGRAGVALIMQDEGLYAPRMRVCRNDEGRIVITSEYLPVPGEAILTADGHPKPGFEGAVRDFFARIRQFEQKFGVKTWDVIVLKDDRDEVDFGYRADEPKGSRGNVNRALRLNRSNFRATRDHKIYVSDADWVEKQGDFVCFASEIVDGTPTNTPTPETRPWWRFW